MIGFCILLAAFSGLSAALRCSNPDSPENCSCDTHPWSGPEIHMTCMGLENPGQLLRALKMNPNVVWLHIVDSHLPYFPLGLAPHGMSELQITNSSIAFLSPPMSERSAFDDLTNLTKIYIKGGLDLSGWDWSKLKPLKNLQLIHIQDSYLPELPSSMSQLGENYYWKLNITNSRLLHISATALGSKTLQVFSSRGNPIRSLRYEIFRPGDAVVELELVGTKITSLESGALNGLKNLLTFVTDANFLSYMTSSHLYRSGNLHLFTVLGEPPNCSCRYSFLLPNGLRWQEHCILKTSSQTVEYVFAEFLRAVC